MQSSSDQNKDNKKKQPISHISVSGQQKFMKMIRLESLQIKDLNFRLGVPIPLVHNFNCLHWILVNDIRVGDAQSRNSNLSDWGFLDVHL
mmetsp:Transcript_57263/g.124515  ORF Transcript_57263/g.124515 Transcript_57263/m.124515 type:complete len:90 (+) Transcript_57263:728-997(+)